MSFASRVRLTQVLIAVLFIGFLEYGPRSELVDPLILPPLTDILEALRRLFESGLLTEQLWVSGVSIALSFTFAAMSGLLIGWSLWRWPALHQALDPYLTSYYALPVFVFYPVLVAMFGLTRTPVVLLGALYACVAVITNTAIGLRAVREVHLKAAKTYGLDPSATFWQVQLPSAAPYVFTGLKLAVSYSIIGVIASEFILATQGMGWLASNQYNSFQLPEMYASIITIMGCAGILTAAVAFLERRLWSAPEVSR